VTVSTNTGPYSFDVDGNGTNDFSLTASGGNVNITALTAAYGIDQSFSKANAYASPASFPATPALATSTKVFSGGPINASNFGTAVRYGDLVLASVGGATVQRYFAGTFDPGPGPVALALVPGATANASTVVSFTLTDFGIVTASTAVPEPGSLALLATGAAGIGLLRRRRAARAA